MDMLRFELRAPRMLSGCDTTTPHALIMRDKPAASHVLCGTLQLAARYDDAVRMFENKPKAGR